MVTDDLAASRAFAAGLASPQYQIQWKPGMPGLLTVPVPALVPGTAPVVTGSPATPATTPPPVAATTPVTPPSSPAPPRPVPTTSHPATPKPSPSPSSATSLP